MTLALLTADPGRAGRGSREPAASLCAGATVVAWAVPPAPTPGNAARAYAEARLDQDWAAMWALICSAAPFADREAFVAHMTGSDEERGAPPPSAVFVSDVHRQEGTARPAFTVWLDVTSLDRDGAVETYPASLPVVLEAGEFRVCFGRA